MENLQRQLRSEFAQSASGDPVFAQEASGERFFSDLKHLISGHPIDEQLGGDIMELARQWVAENSLRHYRNTTHAAYGRTYLGRCAETGWEAIVMSWQQDRPSSIHGHPCFAGYFFADGLFQIELFKRTAPERGVRLTEILCVEAPQGLHAVGIAGRFDNHIHRITCLSDHGHSLHIYSDEVLQGEVFETCERA